METEHPDILIREGLQRTALHRVPMPQPNWENPIPEHSEGYLQKAFPFFFLSGDADPCQDRPVDIRKNKYQWEEDLIAWIVKQPEAQRSPPLLFYLNGRSQRIASRKQVTIAIKNTGLDRTNLPTKEDLLQNPEERQVLASKSMSMKSAMKDSDNFWRKERNVLLNCFRYFTDDRRSYRDDLTPMELSLFQTRALAYNHLPAIHSLFPKSEDFDSKCTIH